MKSECHPSVDSCIFLFILFLFSLSLVDTHNDFLQCFSQQSPNSNSIIFTQNHTSYLSVLNLSIQNPRFSSPSTPKPFVIITPLNASHVQTTIYCTKKSGLQIRVRSGGHDYEGLSYVSDVPFVVLDLTNLRSVIVDLDDKTAFVEAGASIGEVYYTIAENSQCLGFPSATANSVGVGGLFSGGGYGAMLRKHGLSVDHIIDAQLVNHEGRILDRMSMGEDLFWAIRGGGGASFGVIISWKIRLVSVPQTVTVFTVNRNLEQKATNLVHRWQFVADRLDNDLFIIVRLQAVNSPNKTIQASFISLFLGGVDRLIPILKKGFPELGIVREDCKEMSWIESVVYFAGFPSGSSKEVLLDRTTPFKVPIKGKSDYVKVPITVDGLEGIWERLFEEEVGMAFIQMTPYGGRMKEIHEWETPFPHRAGNIYKILYVVAVTDEGEGINNVTESIHVNWIRRIYKYMTPYVSKNPREAYLNYRDLDLGRNNNNGTTCYAQASIWGFKYFKNNFDRLLRVKNMVDPTNFFRNEQSIPPYS
ncbi:hypothetical protein CsatB_001271 [Cannabis sativa]